MEESLSPLEESITLNEAKKLIKVMASKESILLLSPPGVGKSDTVVQAANEAGLPCKSLLGTQIAPEDVSGIPRIVGERSVFCPPRILLPEKPEPFCLFLDELPACAPDVQKAFYSILLDRRIGEYNLPEGSWVVAAGNRVEDRAMVRTLSSALINRVFILNVDVDVKQWLSWAMSHHVRSEILSFISFMPDALMRDGAKTPIPFSTPRAWVSLSHALDLAEFQGILSPFIRRALAFGRVSASDAAIFCSIVEEKIQDLKSPLTYIENPNLIPKEDAACWFVLCQIRKLIQQKELNNISETTVNNFLLSLPQEHRFALLVDMIEEWGRLGAEKALLESLKEITGLE